jgi:hypothetical protein
MPTDNDIEQMNRQILERRAERGAGIATKPPAPSEGPQPRPASDPKNEFRAGLPPLSAAAIAEWIATYRAGYSRFAHDPQGEAIITLMEKRLAAALAADGRTLPPLSSEERLKALRIAAAARGNGIR